MFTAAAFTLGCKSLNLKQKKPTYDCLNRSKPVMYKVAVFMAAHASHMSCVVRVKHAVKTV
ncbi:hypothetical protein GCM10011274_05350 [Paraglaciecola chathamensis]|uniref:Uncharacterized protein n=1 Tax=Paraglaciecola chathamensis TaxID=368405 RepID=A0A8H9I7C1_9ALTE|nr:hypothetical protein GCM10011274_05350 [Paraglaciecola oceanifecundans]